MRIKWSDIFISGQDLAYGVEILVRTLVMFTFVLVFLRMSGKKGVRQLSIFEVAVIIALGSAAGDPMFTKDVAILPSLLVFAVILAIYRIITYFASRSEKIETILEGKPMYIIEEGMFTLKKEGDNTFAKDEFFSEMRAQSIEHLGQVKTALLETNGQVSFYYYSDDEVRPGLPILPKSYEKKSRNISGKNNYACTFCGNVALLAEPSECSRCHHDEWAKAIDSKRIT
ncbi:DUF421 domain-containing protein [Mucilaginibacter pedocola]|uniref:YetF C-terminal domain-containing protein n=1 Tax=Mucilaginibacter pedocola TaxID=1792845 RepID=A0A1S9PKL6_9SPHI|nr:YetF domain-containing protein [Mucilaginibacter pedocola]OOQ61506.1 hypothetical protein BC343_00030 [Mucilaginibacter pedocola]